MRQLIAAMQQQMDQGGTFPRSGVISGYDPSSYAVKVDIMPEGYTTGWIQLDAPGVGNGWGVAIGPQLGDEVTVTFENGDPKLGRVTSRHFNDVNQPIGPPSGEVWITHKTGSLLKFHNDGSVELASTANLTATVGGNLSATVTGTASITAGQAIIKAASIALQNSGAALKNLLNSLFANWAATHVHSNGNGGANTGAPTTSPPANGQTQTVQAE